MIKRLSRIEMVSGNPQKLAFFYQAAFGFLGSDQAEVSSVGICQGIRMKLGKQEIALIGFEHQGRPYPASIAGWNPLFQHIAIVVSDMTSAYKRLSAITGWSPISTAGPQTLPAASGGVTAFKFRDPEGHPLELIAFAPHAAPLRWQIDAPSSCLGIDHSAVSVADAGKSVAFYQSIGLSRNGGSLNIGPEQAKLDNIPNAVVEVTALTPAQPTPHVELLCYRGSFDRHVQQDANDATATRLVFSVEDRNALDTLCALHTDKLLTGLPEGANNARQALLRDPDGHLIYLEIEG